MLPLRLCRLHAWFVEPGQHIQFGWWLEIGHSITVNNDFFEIDGMVLYRLTVLKRPLALLVCVCKDPY